MKYKEAESFRPHWKARFLLAQLQERPRRGRRGAGEPRLCLRVASVQLPGPAAASLLPGPLSNDALCQRDGLPPGPVLVLDVTNPEAAVAVAPRASKQPCQEPRELGVRVQPPRATFLVPGGHPVHTLLL